MDWNKIKKAYEDIVNNLYKAQQYTVDVIITIGEDAGLMFVTFTISNKLRRLHVRFKIDDFESNNAHLFVGEKATEIWLKGTKNG